MLCAKFCSLQYGLRASANWNLLSSTSLILLSSKGGLPYMQRWFERSVVFLKLIKNCDAECVLLQW